MWLNDTAEALPAADRPLLGEAQAEIKLELMATGQADGADEVTALYYNRINGITVREFVVWGLNCRIQRLVRESELYQDILNHDAQLRAADKASAQVLADSIQHNRDVLQKDTEDLQEARDRLARFQSE